LNPLARRTSPRLPWLVVLAASLGAALAGCSVNAQNFDAAALREPVRIGAAGLAQDGDDPAYAQTDFDDSKWLPVDAKTRLREYFPHSQSPIVWRRIHVKVDPGQSNLALQAYDVSRAFEVYVNGRKLIASGQVDPYVAYTREARLIARIPEGQLRTGSLVIAIRIRAPLTTWTSAAPGFRGSTLMLGDEGALNDKNSLSMIGENAVTFLSNLLSLGVGLVALALFLSQRQRREYLWIFILGILSAAILPLRVISIIRNLPASWFISYEILVFATNLAMIFMVRAFLRKPFGWLVLLGTGAGCGIAYAFEIGYLYGALPYSFAILEVIPIAIVFSVILPILLFRQLRRGDREAGILLVPFFFYSLGGYGFIGARLLQQIPPLRSAALRAEQLVFGIPLGIVNVGLGELGILSFYFSLAIIIVLRSARVNRQQGILEGEMAAAREVQQVILPEQVEAVPGFTVESAYQPAQQVGGDFFQILPAGEGGLVLVIGDVAGKGLSAAMLVSVLVGAIRAIADFTWDPAEMLARLNERLIGRTHGGFTTALAAHITADGAVTIANAGHLSPYLDGKEVELPGALPLGIVTGACYETCRFQLPPGKRLTFYSDGVIEAQNQDRELFGFDRAKAISTQTAAAIADAAIQFGQSDDITVVSIQRIAAIATAA
jgi:sigma-B regulation protein RsbU (phosphoserine phosphatase)